MSIPAEEMPFSLDWLAGVGERPQALAVCPEGHLVVNANSHWQPVRLSDDLRALWFRLTDHH